METDIERQNALIEHNNLTAEIKNLSRIETGEQYQRVAQVRSVLKAGIEFFERRWRKHIDAAYQQHKSLIASLNQDQQPAKEGYEYAGRLLTAYDREQERIRIFAQLEAEREARLKAEEEQKRLAALAKELGDKELVKEIKTAPLKVDPVVVEKTVPKVEGLSYRDNWTFKIVDDTKIPREYLIVDQIKIGKIVRALKQETKIPGVEVICEKIPVQK